MLFQYTSIIIKKMNNFFLKFHNQNEIIKLINNLEIQNQTLEKYKNMILFNIVNIKREETDISHDYYEMYGNQYIKKIKPAHFYVYAFIHSTYQNEDTNIGLTYLSEIIGYINSNPALTKENTLEIEKNNLSDINIYLQNDDQNIYNKLTIPYMPSLLIKYGLIPINSQYQNEKPVAGVSSF